MDEKWALERYTGLDWYDTGTTLIHLPLVESVARLAGDNCIVTFASGNTVLVGSEHYDRIRGYIGH